MTPQPPSKGKIARATLIALGVALLLLFTAVLPAEYGYDPLKTGKLLGLTGIAASAADPNAKGRAVVTSAPGQSGVYTSQPKTYKVDSEDFQLMPGEGVEMKYHMQKGAGMVYAWKADGKLLYEFHGEPDQKPNKDYFESYELDDKMGKTESYGSLHRTLHRHSRLVLAEQNQQRSHVPPEPWPASSIPRRCTSTASRKTFRWTK